MLHVCIIFVLFKAPKVIFEQPLFIFYTYLHFYCAGNNYDTNLHIVPLSSASKRINQEKCA